MDATPKAVGIGGIALGALAFWLALPPLAARTRLVPILFGLLAVAAGIWTWSRDERRLGWGAVAAGVLGIALGVLATRSSAAHSTRSSSGARSSPRRCATRRRWRSPAIGGLFSRAERRGQHRASRG